MKICRICLETLNVDEEDNIISFLHPNLNICFKCKEKLKPVFKKFVLNGIEGMYIYEYKDTIRDLLYKFKGQFDIELKSVFLELYKHEIRAMYKDFVIIPVPSYFEQDQIRGFSHVKEMFSVLGLKMIDALIKTKNIKQANLSRKRRWDNRSNINLSDIKVPVKQKILLVDDVMTTGATLIRCIELLKKYQPSVIKILVMSKKVEL